MTRSLPLRLQKYCNNLRAFLMLLICPRLRFRSASGTAAPWRCAPPSGLTRPSSEAQSRRAQALPAYRGRAISRGHFNLPSTTLRSASGTAAPWRCAPPSGLTRPSSEARSPRAQALPAYRGRAISRGHFNLPSTTLSLRLGYGCAVALRAAFGPHSTFVGSAKPARASSSGVSRSSNIPGSSTSV